MQCSTRLIEIDEITGEQFVIICGGPGAVDVIFAVEVDMDLDTLDETKYQVNRR